MRAKALDAIIKIDELSTLTDMPLPKTLTKRLVSPSKSSPTRLNRLPQTAACKSKAPSRL